MQLNVMQEKVVEAVELYFKRKPRVESKTVKFNLETLDQDDIYFPRQMLIRTGSNIVISRQSAHAHIGPGPAQSAAAASLPPVSVIQTHSYVNVNVILK